MVRWVQWLAAHLVGVGGPGSRRVQADRMRAELERRGLGSVDGHATLAARLGELPEPAPAAFAAAVAERMLRREETACDAELVRRWRELLDAVWAALGGDESGLQLVEREVDSLERWLDLDPMEPVEDFAGADLDHVAATLFAAQALLRRSPEAAAWAGQRGTDAADEIAQNELLAGRTSVESTDEARLASHPLVQAEIARQRSDMALLTAHGVTAQVLAALRAP